MNLCYVKCGRVLLMRSSGCPTVKYALQKSICKMVYTFTSLGFVSEEILSLKFI